MDDRGRSWTYRFGVDPATGLINELRLDRVQHQEVTVRFATEADGPALAEIERRSPMVMGEVTVTIDRGGDYFAAARLMGDVVVVVAEIDGEPAAAHCAAAHTVHVGGRPYRLGYFHHLRILPEHQGKGLFGRMAEKMGERYYPPHVDGNYAYVSADNTLEDSSGLRVEREGLVLDHGFAPGHELAFLELLRAWCSHLDARGITQLVIFSSGSSPTYPLLQTVGAHMAPFDLYLFGPSTPDDAAERGVYVDHVYF